MEELVYMLLGGGIGIVGMIVGILVFRPPFFNGEFYRRPLVIENFCCKTAGLAVPMGGEGCSVESMTGNALKEQRVVPGVVADGAVKVS